MRLLVCYLEKKWMQKLSPADKKVFRTIRYMDDTLMMIAKQPDNHHLRIIKDFEETCYTPLQLEDGAKNTFLETRFSVEENHLRHWLKNDNEGGENKVWRYQHYHSHAPFLQKQALLTSCLKKVQKLASSSHELYKSAWEKLREFQRLAYPITVLRGACKYLAASTGTALWLDIRDQFD